jgi:hypothetical protein
MPHTIRPCEPLGSFVVAYSAGKRVDDVQLEPPHQGADSDL